MTLKQMVDYHFGGCRNAAAKAGDISLDNLNMCISRGYYVAELKRGGFVMLTKKTKTFNGGE